MASFIKRRLDRLEGAELRYLLLGELLDELDTYAATVAEGREGRLPHPDVIAALNRLSA